MATIRELGQRVTALVPATLDCQKKDPGNKVEPLDMNKPALIGSLLIGHLLLQFASKFSPCLIGLN